jgi:hypothetical protein
MLGPADRLGDQPQGNPVGPGYGQQAGAAMTDALVLTMSGRRPRVAHWVWVRADERLVWLALVAGIGLQAAVTALLGLSLTAADSLLMLVFAAAACTVLATVAARGSRHVSVGHAPGFAAAGLVERVDRGVVRGLLFGRGGRQRVRGVHVGSIVCPAWGDGIDGFSLASRRQSACAWPHSMGAARVLAVLGTSLVAVMARSDPGRRIALLVAGMLRVIAGIAAGGVAIVSRGLGRSGVGVGQVMAHRFYATETFAVTALLTLIPCALLAPLVLDVGVIGVGALACIVAPLLLGQYAMQRLAPVSCTAAAVATMPAITIAVELASGRALSWMVLLLGVLIVPGNLALLVTQQQPEKGFAAALRAARNVFPFRTPNTTRRTTPVETRRSSRSDL